MMKSVAIVFAYIFLATCSMWCSILIGIIAGWLWQSHKQHRKPTYKDMKVALTLDAGLFSLRFVFLILALSCWYLGYNDHPWIEPVLSVCAPFSAVGFWTAKYI